MTDFSVDGKEILTRIIKYLAEAAVVVLAIYLIPKNKLSGEEMLTVGLVAAATFSLLDMFAPSVSANAYRAGLAGGIGLSLTPVGQALMK